MTARTMKKPGEGWGPAHAETPECPQTGCQPVSLIDEFNKSWFASDNWHRDVYLDPSIRCSSCGMTRTVLEHISLTGIHDEEFVCCMDDGMWK